jgi:hypothetical protein
VTDKDVERNVRSTTVEGIRTPTEKHVHGIGEKHSIAFGEASESGKTKEELLEKFRRREKKRRTVEEKQAEKEKSEPGKGGAESPAE